MWIVPLIEEYLYIYWYYWKYNSNKRVCIISEVYFKNIIRKGLEYLIDYNLIYGVSKEG